MLNLSPSTYVFLSLIGFCGSIWAYRYSKIVSFPILVMAYLSLSSTLYYLHVIFGFYKYLPPVVTSTNYHNINLLGLVYSTIYMIALITVVISKPAKYRKKLTQIIDKKVFKYIYSVFILVFILNFIFLKKDLLLYNNEYLLLGSRDSYVGASGFGVILKQLLFLSSCLSAFILPSLIKNKDKFGLVILTILLCVYVYFMVSHSRTSVVLLGSLLAGLMIVKSQMIYKLITISLLPISLIYVLAGRGSGEHGILTFYSNFSFINLSEIGQTFLYSFINIFQGGFLTAEGIQIDAKHSLLYKNLSISIFPSFIDGFSLVREYEEIRIGSYVPMSAVAEVYNFGILYSVFLLFLLAIIFYMSHRLFMYKTSIIIIFANIYFMLLFYVANTYPLRNVFKQYIFITFILIVIRFWSNKTVFRSRSLFYANFRK